MNLTISVKRQAYYAIQEENFGVVFAIEELFQNGKVLEAIDVFRIHAPYGEVQIDAIATVLSSSLVAIAGSSLELLGNEKTKQTGVFTLQAFIDWLNNEVLHEGEMRVISLFC